MKIAIIILIHEYNEQQKKLIKHLAKDFDVYVHIDKKLNINIEDIDCENVFAFKEYKVYWGSFNQIRATLLLYKEADKNKYDRYCFISGNDIPLVSNSDLVSFFSKNKGEYLAFDKLPVSFWGGNGGLDRMDYYYTNMQCRGKINIFVKLYGKILNRINLQIVIPILKMLKIKRSNDGIVFYGGTNWMDLSRSCVEQIVMFTEKNPEFINRFKYTRNADEIFFQTIICNYVKDVELNKNCLRYIDWFTGPELPRVLRYEDYSKMKSSNCLFARKVDSKIDTKIIDTIYSEIDEGC